MWRINTVPNIDVIKPKSVPSNNLFPTATASGSSQSSFDPFDVSSDDKEDLMPNDVAETTPGWRDDVACLQSATTL